jgi:hypothetical protein
MFQKWKYWMWKKWWENNADEEEKESETKLFMVLISVFMKMPVLRDMTKWRFINIYRRFRVYAGGDFWGCRGSEDVGGAPLKRQ